MGIDAIISFSAPVLSLIYPAALVIIVLILIPVGFIQTKAFFRTAVAVAFIYGIYTVL